MFLKKVIPLLALLLLNLTGLQAGSFLDGNDLSSQEIVIQYAGEKGYLHILEYNIRTFKKSKEDKEAQAAQMMEDAQNCLFIKKRFKLDQFTSLQETFRVKDRMLNGEYHLMTRDENALDLLKAIVSEILGQEVKVEESPKLIILLYDNGEFQAVAGGNCAGPVERDGKSALLWKPGTRNFQMVFNGDLKGKPLRKLFPEKTGSRELTPEEIIHWRDQ